ncbi:MAG: Do family serine endopeptidase [Buchnera aphidicola (Eriosoma harunire)]
MKKINMILKILLTITLLIFLNIPQSFALENSVTFNSIPSLAPMLKKIIPAVVSINVEGISYPKHTSYFFDGLSPFSLTNSCSNHQYIHHLSLKCYHQISNYHYSKSKTFHSLGSGVIINSEHGYIVTNNHVVEHANNIQVYLSDGRQLQAKVIGRDVRSDIAVLQLTSVSNLTAITLANSDLIQVGDYTVAIGNPYGLGESVTAGVVSALGRSGLRLENYENFIQTDAAINRGNSGGALVNLKGELIGINTAILAPDGGNIGIGFAIPSNMVKNIITQIIEYGEVKRGELGIIGTELNSELARAMKLKAHHGIFVNRVKPKSSAAKAGVKSGDIIISINKKFVSNFPTFRAEISSFPINTKISLGILRHNVVHNILVLLTDNFNHKVSFFTGCKMLKGAYFVNYNDNYGHKNVKVYHIIKNSNAYKVGFKNNDIIISINKCSITNLKDFKRFFERKLKILAFHLKRRNHQLYLVLHL